MTKEEYQKYLDDQKSNLTDKDKLSLQRECNWKYWWWIPESYIKDIL